MANAKQKSTSASHLQNLSKPSYFFCKFLIIILVLLTIPLFPSQAPEFSTFSTFFTKLWEPLQLLFVGLAVCYGLFCKRSSTRLEIEDFNVDGKNEAQDLCFYGGLDMSSIFEDGFRILCGYDEKIVILESEERCGGGEGDGVVEKDDGVEQKVTKSWNSRYLCSKSMVVVANGGCVVDEWGQPVSKREYKNLNLPVRSLRSSIVVDDKYEESETIEGDCSVEGAIKIRGVRPINLEKKFEEVSSPAPPVSWQTRSCMMEMKEETRRRSLRPHSVGEFDIDPKSSGMEVSLPRIASEKSFTASKSLHSSFGSSLDMTLQRGNNEIFKETKQNQKEDNFNGENRGNSSVDLEAKPTKIPRVLSRGKSVRTIRASKIVPYTGESNASEVYGENQDSSILNLEGHKNHEVEMKLNIDNHFPGPEVELPESQSEDKQDCFESSTITSRDNSESESQFYPSSSDEEIVRSDIEGSEVDRKAGEFIAKFREQIRLQKLASAKRPGNTDIRR